MLQTNFREAANLKGQFPRSRIHEISKTASSTNQQNEAWAKRSLGMISVSQAGLSQGHS